jgi:hypothetical protein
MKYALLIYPRPDSHAELPPDEHRAVTREYVALAQEEFVLAGEGLQPPDTATTLRMEDGRTLVTDGPFASTKEFFGGFYVIEAENLDRALAIAERIPAIRLGGAVEVRPIMEMET